MHRLLTLHLSLIEGVGPAAVARLAAHPDFADLYACSAHRIAVHYQVSMKIAEAVAHGLKDIALLEREAALIDRHHISWVTTADEAYPPLLKEISCPPTVLYYRGARLHTFEKNIAVIGSRKAGDYAREVVAACVPPLVQAGWQVISGGALGADTMAHEQTLFCGGKTVAVWGSGLLCPYPRSNSRLFERIVDAGGAVISSFPLQTEPHPYNFPARNRIIAGMSQACLVVQAAERSGASITAEFALNQGKHVLAVPGSIFDPLSAGCHALIKEGATPIGSAEDLFKELGEKPAVQTSFVQEPSGKQVKKSMQAVALPEPVAVPDRIVFHCKNPISAEDLLEHVTLDFSVLQDHLFDLQLAGRLEQNAVGLWQATAR